RRVAGLRSALLDTVVSEDVAAIARALVDKAKKGDVPAAKLVLAYTLGKPAPAVQPDQLDIEEWQIFRDTAPMAAEMPTLGMAPSPELPRDVVRRTRPLVAENLGRQMSDMLHQPADTPAAGPQPAAQPNRPSTNGKNSKRAQAQPS